MAVPPERCQPPSEACAEGFSKGHSRALEANLQPPTEQEPKGPFSRLPTARAPSPFPQSHPNR